MNRYEGDSFIASNDLTDLLEEKDAERQALVDAAEEAEEPIEKTDLEREVDMWDEEYNEAFSELQRVCDGLPDQETCIVDDKIDDYLEDMVADFYELPKDLPDFITLTIDYDALKQDYTSFEYLGNTYWVRCV